MENILMRIDFEEHFKRLIAWFRTKGMTRDQADVFYSKVRLFPLAGFISAVDYFLENFKPTPGNFPTPKEIVNQIYQWIEQNPEERFKRTRYDTKEDFTYPIKKLWDGYNVLLNQGDEAFSKFAFQNRMPANDQERVKMKVNVVRRLKTNKFNEECTKMIDRVGFNVTAQQTEGR